MTTVIDLLQKRLQAAPEKVVFRYWQNEIVDELTFAALDQRAHAVAAQLQSVAQPGERVILALPQSLNPIVAFFACLYSGAVAVPIPLPPMNRLELLKRFAGDAQAQTVLTVSAVSSTLKAEAEAAGLGHLRWVDMDAADASADGWKPVNLTADMPALMLYTSGSTNLPRGIIATQGNLAAAVESAVAPFKGRGEVNTVAWTPLQSAMGLLLPLQILGYDGWQLWIAPPAFIQKPITWLKLISDYRANLSVGATFAYRLCVDAVKPEEREGLDLSSWKFALCGGEPVRWEALKQFARVYEPYGFSFKSFSPVYGMSESMGCTQSDIDRGPKALWLKNDALEQRCIAEVPEETSGARPFVSCGAALPGFKMLIVNPDTRQPCAPDEIGELWIAGPAVTQGYWNKPKETEEIFNAHLAGGEGPYLRSGDLAFMKDGELYIAGRLKDVIIINGRNLSAVDFEMAASASHPALMPGAAAAFSVTMEDEEKVVLMHETRPGQEEVNVEDVASAIRLAVSDKMNVPLSAVMLVKPGSLPRTGSGKIQRYLCRARYLESQAGEKK
ncbi:MAG: fatty acyl-AMP ligase [Chloroflexota bacterium]